jgi:uncharacterized protein with NRDE domain
MCLFAVAHRLAPDFPLVIAANRDEAYDRPSTAAHAWEEDPRVAGGRDLRAGGSWLAVRAGGRFAAITNVRGARAEGPSRGLLVSRFVRGDVDALAFAESIDRDAYAGFHLVIGDGTTIAHVSNAGDAPPSIVAPGSVFAVSNGVPGDDWPKVRLARDAMLDALAHAAGVDALTARLLDFLTTRRGGPLEQEVFVVSPGYGTRSSTAIVVDREGTVALTERAAPVEGEVRLRLPSPS